MTPSGGKGQLAGADYKEQSYWNVIGISNAVTVEIFFLDGSPINGNSSRHRLTGGSLQAHKIRPPGFTVKDMK